MIRRQSAAIGSNAENGCGGIAERAFSDPWELAKGLSLGMLRSGGWLAYILSEGDHRLNSVRDWAVGLLMTLAVCLKTVGLRDLDFSDDRLWLLLDYLGRDEMRTLPLCHSGRDAGIQNHRWYL